MQQHSYKAPNRVLGVTEKISRICVIISGFVLLFAVGLIGVEVVLRKAFSISIGGADEISSYALATCISWSLGYALIHKGHIRIDLLYCKLSDRLKSALDLLAMFSMLAFVGPLSFFAYEVFRVSFERGSTANTPLQTPMWIPQGIWFSGLLSFLITIVIVLVSAIILMLRKDFKGARKVAGATSIEEEIEEETGIQID